MREAAKFLVIGLDGGTFDLLEPLMENGHMPRLEALRDSGSWGPLASTIPPFTGSAWSSLITGQNPGRHGILSFSRRDRFNYDVTGSGFVNAQRFAFTLWELLGEAGKRVGVVNVPMTYPPRPVNGFMVTGMLTPPGAEHFTYPPDFARRLGNNYVIDVDFLREGEGFRLHGLPPKEGMLPVIERMTRERLLACHRLLQEEPWDFFMTVFTGTDRISHFFWDDLTRLLKGGLVPETLLEKRLLDYFEKLDRGIGRMVDAAGPKTTILILSDHGFGPAPTRRFYLNVWLEQLGLLRLRRAEGIFDLDHWRVRMGKNWRLKALFRRILPQRVQDSIRPVTEAASGREIIDWSQTQAYFVPIYFHVCGIDINVSGERREGIVKPGAAYERIRDSVLEAARRVSDPETGKRVVTLAARREELYDGPYITEFPDVIIVLDPEYIGAKSLAGSSLCESHPHPMRPGEHREDGIFIAAGANIRSRQQPLLKLKLIDATATIVYGMGLPILDSFDGRALTEIFEPAFLEANPTIIREQAIDEFASLSSDNPLTEDETAALEGRLRGLGYLE